MKIIVDSKENISKLAAEMIAAQISAKPDCAVAFAAGQTPEGVYEELAKMQCIDFSACEAFNICEYEGLEAGDPRSCSGQLQAQLYSKLGITKIHTPTADNADSFDDEIASCGGLELILLGIGTNGHIGFNEPATLYDTETHIAQLTDKTKQMKAAHFGGAENVPSTAVTMGLKTICRARNVILIAFGEEKADIVYKLVYGKTSTYVPAAMLQMHINMTLMLDEGAASKLN